MECVVVIKYSSNFIGKFLSAQSIFFRAPPSVVSPFGAPCRAEPRWLRYFVSCVREESEQLARGGDTNSGRWCLSGVWTEFESPWSRRIRDFSREVEKPEDEVVALRMKQSGTYSTCVTVLLHNATSLSNNAPLLTWPRYLLYYYYVLTLQLLSLLQSIGSRLL